MIYVISPEFLVASVAGDVCYDGKAFKGEINRLKKVGIRNFCLFHKQSMEYVHHYFTRLTRTIVPITGIEVRN